MCKKPLRSIFALLPVLQGTKVGKRTYYSVKLVFVSCKNRIFPKNPVFLYSSTHKIKVDKAL